MEHSSGLHTGYLAFYLAELGLGQIDHSLDVFKRTAEKADGNLFIEVAQSIEKARRTFVSVYVYIDCIEKTQDAKKERREKRDRQNRSGDPGH